MSKLNVHILLSAPWVKLQKIEIKINNNLNCLFFVHFAVSDENQNRMNPSKNFNVEFMPSHACVDNPEYHLVSNEPKLGIPQVPLHPLQHRSSEEESDHEYYNDFDRLRRELQPLRTSRNETTVWFWSRQKAQWRRKKKKLWKEMLTFSEHWPYRRTLLLFFFTYNDSSNCTFSPSTFSFLTFT